MKLYTCALSRGFRVTWLAHEMGLDLDYQMLPFPPRFQRPEYLDKNPLGTVPMLVDGETRMTESSAILFYLATRYGGEDYLVTSDDKDFGPLLDFSSSCGRHPDLPADGLYAFCLV